MAQLNGLAIREGDVLILKLESGKTKSYRDDREACEKGVAADCVKYELRGYRQDQKTYVVGYSLYEGGGANIISAQSGHTVFLSSLPEFSPNSRSFVSADSDPHFERAYEIAIWSFTSDSPKQEFLYSTPKGHPEESWEVLGWDGNDRINLKVGILNETDSTQELETSVIRTEQGWKLNWPLSNLK
ncbi:hypothetical protein [Microvirga soli]|uniref:hypothetical protein n=1 Tax=Microvirga soli TaxID=1854496 RepID=UPI00191E4C7D|nr:hypothetical protein [Microvirga soli]